MDFPDLSIENSLKGEYKCIAGIDEAGRGALAGPVVAAAVVVADCKIDDLGINDSKKLSARRREIIFEELIKRKIKYGIGIIDNNAVDEVNVLNAANMAFLAAVNDLPVKPDYLLIDGNCYRNKGIDYECIIKGDSKSLSIAAASIIAKVTRDKLMINLSEQLQKKYDFQTHKGYGTKKHFELIKKNGVSDIHRKSFLVKFVDREFTLFNEY